MADVELRLVADVDNAVKGIGSLSKEYQGLVNQLAKPLKQVNAFRELESSLEDTERQARSARERVRDLGNELARTAEPSKQLTAQYRDAVNELRRLERAETTAQQRLAQRRRELQGAGIDTRNLVAEQQRLSQELQSALSAGQADQRLRLARANLGVGEIEAAQRQLAELRNEYRLVMSQGDLSARQRAEAETVYHQRVRQTLAELRKMRAAIADQGTQAQRAAATERQRSQAAREGIRAQAAALAQLAREQRAANIEAARQSLGVNRYRDLQAQIGRIRAEYQLLRSTGGLTARELAIAQRSMTERVRETQRALREMNAEQRRASGISRLAGGIGGAVGAIGAGYAAVSAVTHVARTADAYKLMNARLRLATESQEEFNVAQRELSRIAQDTETPVQSLVTLYGRISRPLREAGRSQQDILALTEAVSTSFRVSGATAQEAENGVIQFAQALGAGALRGDEFNSVAEQAPRLMQALADGIGVPVGALKEMAAQGELTAQVVTEALTGQLETLRQEADALPDTVGGAMTKLADRWREAIGQADVQPLINSINNLGETLSDPVVIDNLIKLASALATLAGGAVGATSDFVDMGKQIGFTIAKAQGMVTELDAIDNELKAIEKSLDGSWSPGDLLTDLFFTEEELRAKRDALLALRATLVEQQTGLNEEMQFLAEVAQAAAEQARNNEISSYTKYIADLDTLRKSQIKAAQDGAKALVSAEKKALSDLQKVRDERLAIDQRYQQALADIQRGPGGEPSLMQYNALRRGAQAALDNGDIAGAKQQAQAALKVLQDLAAAGESTVGFSFFVRELRDIEMAANDLEESNAEDKLASIRDEMQQLKDKAKKLEGLPVSVKTDDATIEQVRSTIEELVAQLNQKEVVIPVRVLRPDIAVGGKAEPSTSVPALATGGILRGPGTGTSDSILARLSNGEGVINARAVQYYGADLIHQLNNLRAPRFATGGVMGNVPVPSIPSLAPALQQQLASGSGGGSNEDWGSMVIDLGNGPAPIRMPRSTAEALRREALKRGSPGRSR